MIVLQCCHFKASSRNIIFYIFQVAPFQVQQNTILGIAPLTPTKQVKIWHSCMISFAFFQIANSHLIQLYTKHVYIVNNLKINSWKTKLNAILYSTRTSFLHLHDSHSSWKTKFPVFSLYSPCVISAFPVNFRDKITTFPTLKHSFIDATQ